MLLTINAKLEYNVTDLKNVGVCENRRNKITFEQCKLLNLNQNHNSLF